MKSVVRKRAALALSLLAALAVALVAATAGNSASTRTPPRAPAAFTSALNAVRGLSASARDAKLYQLAQQEGGQLNFYTSLTSLSAPALVKAFNAAYPNVKVNLFRGSSEDVTAKVLAERNAHTQGGDVVETNGTTMLEFQHMLNVLIPYTKSPYRAKVRKSFRFYTFTADRIEKFVLAWNTNLVQPQDVPKTWADLADPKWKGKIALEPTDGDWFATMYQWMLAHGSAKFGPLSKAKVNAIWRGIGRNAQLINGHTTMSQLLAAGQYAIAVNGHAQSLEQLQAKHAPVSFVPFHAPIIDRPQGIGIPYSVEHPAAALLFYDFVLSSAGQSTLNTNGVQPAWGIQDASFKGAARDTVSMNLRPVVSHIVFWQKLYNSFIQSGK
jgi:iron(III) transport system substrate-binding protein